MQHDTKATRRGALHIFSTNLCMLATRITYIWDNVCHVCASHVRISTQSPHMGKSRGKQLSGAMVIVYAYPATAVALSCPTESGLSQWWIHAALPYEQCECLPAAADGFTRRIRSAGFPLPGADAWWPSLSHAAPNGLAIQESSAVLHLGKHEVLHLLFLLWQRHAPWVCHLNRGDAFT